MKKYTKILLTITMIANLFVSASADAINASYNRSLKAIELNGELGSFNANSRLIIFVTKDGVLLPNVDEEGYADNVSGSVSDVVVFSEISSDENGNYFADNISCDGISGKLNIRLSADNENTVHTYTVFVPEAKAEKEFLEAIARATSQSDVQALLDSEAQTPSYGADMRYYILSDRSSVSKIVFDNKSAYTGNDAAQKLDDDIFINSFLSSISATNDSEKICDIINISDSGLSTLDKNNVSRMMNLDSLYNNSVFKYLKSVSSDNLSNIVSAAAKMNFTTVSEFADALYISTINNRFQSVNGWRDAYRICMECSDVLNGIKSSKLSNSANNQALWTALAEDTYSSVKQLEDAFNNFKEDSSSENSSGNKGNSNSGSTRGNSGTISVGGNPSQNAQDVFGDLQNHAWAKTAIEELYKRGIVNGVGNGMYNPNANVTREEFVKLIVTALNIKGDAAVNFGDIDNSAWYSEYIRRAYANGIVNGISQENFGIGNSITRQDMAVIASRALDAMKISFNENSVVDYTDSEEIDSYAEEAVRRLSKYALISGNTDGTFAPHRNMTRAEAAVLIYNIVSKSGR